MVKVIASNILSPLGMTTDENFRAVMDGRSGLQRHESGCRGVPFPFVASLFDERQWGEIAIEGLTRFEGMMVRSVREALTHTDIEVASERNVFILSTTKGDIGTAPSTTAQHIADHLGMAGMPVVVCNACISGVAAQVLAIRLLRSGAYDNAIVAGGDIQGLFTVSGFNSLQALSPEPCRPFDIERLGLNLGEGAATLILSNREGDGWHIIDGAICNDAWHISSPHPKGEGAYRALMQTLGDFPLEELGVVGVHGTATMYNDQMESKAIERAGLSDIPLSALKGYYGHTMGAAGVIESVLTARALEEGVILPSKGYSERGVSGKVTISSGVLRTGKRAFVKMLSGFGGGNGAVLWCMGEHSMDARAAETVTLERDGCVRLSGQDDLTALYKGRIGGYPRFYKMDVLSRLAFVAAELLLKEEARPGGNATRNGTEAKPDEEELTTRPGGKATRNGTEAKPDEEELTTMPGGNATRNGTCGDGRAARTGAVVLFNRSSSCVSDREFLSTIEGEFFPSPSVFVYTLPNICTGEIALRNGMHGETAFYILPERDERMMERILTACWADLGCEECIAGWVDADAEREYCAEMGLYRKAGRPGSNGG